MRKLGYVVAAVLVLSFVGCGPQRVRYSTSEIGMFSPAVQTHIRNQEVALGMPMAAVRYSWGSPQRIRAVEPDDEGRPREEWVYTKFRVYATRVIFTEGKVTGIIAGLSKEDIDVFEWSSEKEEAPAAPAEPAAPVAPAEETGK